jgi:hypothetical protein
VLSHDSGRRKRGLAGVRRLGRGCFIGNELGLPFALLHDMPSRPYRLARLRMWSVSAVVYAHPLGWPSSLSLGGVHARADSRWGAGACNLGRACRHRARPRRGRRWVAPSCANTPYAVGAPWLPPYRPCTWGSLTAYRMATRWAGALLLVVQSRATMALLQPALGIGALSRGVRRCVS